MKDKRLGEVETRFADIIWRNEPLSSGELVKRCEEELSWKKPTTYTVLRKLCDRGIFQNTNGTVTSCISRETFYALQSEQVLEEGFSGSFPAFFAAFAAHKPLTGEELAELRRLIDSYDA